VWMSKCDSSARVRRVSSQAIRSTSRSTRSARAETSSRLPIGVATTKRVPRALRLRGLFVGFGDQHRPLVVHDDLARDDALLEALDGRQLVHDLEHDLFEDRAQARAPVPRLSASLAMQATASSVNLRRTFSRSKYFWYCLMIAFLGSLRIRTSAASSRSCRVAITGRRPTNSGIRP